jgi:hypothetical protein
MKTLCKLGIHKFKDLKDKQWVVDGKAVMGKKCARAGCEYIKPTKKKG